MIKRLTYLLVLAILLSGCIIKHPCVNGPMDMAFIGFSPADIDTIIVRTYKVNDNYAHLIDTLVIRDHATGIYTVGHDTTVVFINDGMHGWLTADYDWQIYIPAKKRTISLSNITTEPIDGRGRVCFNPVTSFKLDGLPTTPHLVENSQFYASGYLVYIKNE
jgi:hypothetical protein